MKHLIAEVKTERDLDWIANYLKTSLKKGNVTRDQYFDLVNDLEKHCVEFNIYTWMTTNINWFDNLKNQ